MHTASLRVNVARTGFTANAGWHLAQVLWPRQRGVVLPIRSNVQRLNLCDIADEEREVVYLGNVTDESILRSACTNIR